MATIKIKYRPGATDNSVTIDGYEIKDIVRRVSVSVDKKSGAIAELVVEGLDGIEMSAEGNICIDKVEMPEELARELHIFLWSKYGDLPIPQS